MKLTRSFVAALAVLGLLCGQDSRPANDIKGLGNDAVKGQVKNLDNDSFELRTKAMESLRAAGEDARAELEAATKSDSLEVRTRAESLLKELDARKAGTPSLGRKPGEVRPLAPEAEVRGEKKPTPRSGQPRIDEFQDPRAYVEALRKWMEEQMDKDSRFPGWIFQDEKDPFLKDFAKDFGKDFVILEPNDLRIGTVITRQSNGESMTFRNGVDGVTLKVTRKNEAGETVVDKWEAKDVEELKEKYPDVWEKYHPTDGTSSFSFRSGRNGRAPADRGELIPVSPGLRTDVTPAMPLIQSAGPMLGVSTSAVPAVLDKQLKLKGEGVVIESVSADSLASKMGMQPLDVLTHLNGKVIKDRNEIIRMMASKDLPATVTARVVREGAIIELSGTR